MDDSVSPDSESESEDEDEKCEFEEADEAVMGDEDPNAAAGEREDGDPPTKLWDDYDPWAPVQVSHERRRGAGEEQERKRRGG